MAASLFLTREFSVIPQCLRCAIRRALKRPAKIGESLRQQAKEPFLSGFFT
jgi:hypothetical protein